jgi:arsenate reductase-like glutaredoxin family protein
MNINENDNFFSLNKEKNIPEVTIYASPSCTHCETAVDFFKNFCCTNENIKVFVKPVSLSAKDKEKAIQGLCENLFNSKGNPLEQRIAENFIIKNEKELKNKIGQIQTPYIEIDYGKNKKVLLGWNESEFLTYLSAILDKNKIIKNKIENNSIFNPEKSFLLKENKNSFQEKTATCTPKSQECLL